MWLRQAGALWPGLKHVIPVPRHNSIRVENGLNFPSPRREKNLLNDEQIEECQDSLELKPVRA